MKDSVTTSRVANVETAMYDVKDEIRELSVYVRDRTGSYYTLLYLYI